MRSTKPSRDSRRCSRSMHSAIRRSDVSVRPLLATQVKTWPELGCATAVTAAPRHSDTASSRRLNGAVKWVMAVNNVADQRDHVTQRRTVSR